MDASTTIIYSSDLTIDDPAELSTLCVFYDKVLLPSVSRDNVRKYLAWIPWKGRWGLLDLEKTLSVKKTDDVLPADVIVGTSHDGKVLISFDKEHVEPDEYELNLQNWSVRNEVLFREQALERIAAPSPEFLDSDSKNMSSSDRRTDYFLNAKSPIPAYGQIDNPARILKHVPMYLGLHLLRTDLTAPQLFTNRNLTVTRELMVKSEAKMLFSYLLPGLAGLSPEQILEVRHKVRDTRQGFSMHLQKLSKNVEERLRGGENAEGIELLARRVFETELIPDYREFRRQLTAERSGFWNKVLDVTTKAFQIDAAPWTPKFYAELLRAIGVTTLTLSSERKERLTNRYQAFQFMRAVEDTNRFH